MPRPTEISTRVLPSERFIVSIHGERSGRVLRQVVVSETTASRLCSVVDTGDTIAKAGAELVRAAEALGRAFDPKPAPRKIGSRRAR